jgi:hypothetical protein
MTSPTPVPLLPSFMSLTCDADEVKQNQRVLEHGVYQSVPYSVFLKEENRGKRDSQWIFVELLRNMVLMSFSSYKH